LVTQQQNPAFNVSGSINPWNITFWDGGAMPAGSFNVLVTASHNGPWSAFPDYSALGNAISSAGGTSNFFGDRVMLTGQDADFHYMSGVPGPGDFNGPAGFLINSINWAGSGNGMGAVILSNDLVSLFAGSGVTGNSGGQNDTVIIPPAFANFALNTGLTSEGLSDWLYASHQIFEGFDPTLWTAINVDGDGGAVTLVSARTAAGGTSPSSPVPESGPTLSLGAIAMGALLVFHRRARRAARA
jgi:hypothetical protein